MAESVVSFAIEILAPLVQQEVLLLKNFSSEFRAIRADLESIRVLLKDADAKGEAEHGEQVKLWLKELRHVAFNIEDLVEEYVFRHHKQQHELHRHGSCCGFLYKIKYFLSNLMGQHHLVTQIQDIKARLQNVSSRRGKFNLSPSYQLPRSTVSVRDPRADGLFVEETELVGIEAPKNQLIGWLLYQGDLRLGVVSVFGPGGLGKTTLVRKVYENEKVKAHFPYHVWLTVSQKYQIKHLLIELIKVTLNHEEKTVLLPLLETSGTIQLKEMLQNRFQRTRYMVVLDDLWDVSVWKDIKSALPDEEPRCTLYGS